MRQFSSSAPLGSTAAGRTGRRFCAVLMAASVIGLTACSSVREKLPSAASAEGMFTPYRIDVLQGNVVTREQAQALRPGLPREQVRGLLGSPLLASVFHADRWDYVFSFKRQGQAPQHRRVSVFFKGDLLDRFEAEDLPSESEFVSSLDARRKLAKAPALEASEAQLKAFEARNAASGAAPAPGNTAPAINYPPLETPKVTR